MAKKIPVKQGKNREIGYKRPPKKTRWKPGQSGNPAGRPKSVTLSEAYRIALAQPFPGDPQGRTYAEIIAEKLVMNAATGEVSSAREIADRTEGRPKQMLDVDVKLLDWRELARAHGLTEEDVIAEARRLIESVADSSGADGDQPPAKRGS
jgi:hypothetical protein